MRDDTPKPRKAVVFVTDAEWRAVRVAAASHDTSIQGYVTAAVLRRLQRDDRQALDAGRSKTT